MPRVSVGVPVFNGATLIEKCLSNLAGQSFQDIEVIISDNASTDGTAELCEAFASLDRRFRLIRRQQTSTAMENFLHVRRQAASPLFMWRAFDDLSSPNFIEALVDVHARNPGIALAAPGIVQRFGSAKPERTLPYLAAPEGVRVAGVLHRMRRMQAGWFYGLWSLGHAERATEEVFRLFPDGWAADYLALFHATLNGGIAGTNSASFHQQILREVRDYMPRAKPSYAEMTDRNRRFSATCRALIASSDLGFGERALVRSYLPLFINRCSHRLKRVLQAGARRLLKG